MMQLLLLLLLLLGSMATHRRISCRAKNLLRHRPTVTSNK